MTLLTNFLNKIFFTDPTKKINTYLILIAIMIVSGCQLTNKSPLSTPTYGHYYLWLKSLSEEELLQEIDQQKQNELAGHTESEVYLLLLHALPKSPIHNPYTAKSMLNQFQLQYIESRYNPTNLALITLLRDQLNEELLSLQKLEETTEQYKLLQIELTNIQTDNNDKSKKLLQLQQQIIQLRKIENTINEHGQ